MFKKQTNQQKLFSKTNKRNSLFGKLVNSRHSNLKPGEERKTNSLEIPTK